MPLDLDDATRRALLDRLTEVLAHGLRGAQLLPSRTELPELDFSCQRAPLAVLESIVAGLREGIVQTGHPGYFGLFNPATGDMAVAAAALVAWANPQLATHGHAPWPVAIERRLIQTFGACFGFPACEGSFTSGGAEANATALWAALFEAFPEASEQGVAALGARPMVYVSDEGHATVSRSARLAGLGRASVRIIPADRRSRMKVATLRDALARDRADGARPFLIVGTAGTTSAGAIDPLGELADVAARHGCWFHVDAAWGGVAALVPELRDELAGVERADSITFDAHKALSAPMGSGMFLTRRLGVLERTFHDRGGYMPRDASLDPYAHSAQWSRRFIGLPLFAALATIGLPGFAEVVRRQMALADRLRAGVVARGYQVVNETKLPLVCFVHPERRDLDAIARRVTAEGAGWLSVARLGSGQRVLRACVDNHRTAEADVDRLLAAL